MLFILVLQIIYYFIVSLGLIYFIINFYNQLDSLILC